VGGIVLLLAAAVAVVTLRPARSAVPVASPDVASPDAVAADRVSSSTAVD
jgi:hypothetical protein